MFAAGEDTGGVHGANRLGGNGVANSTVFGGIAGDSMAAWVQRERRLARARRGGDRSAASRRTKRPSPQPPGSLEPIREALFDVHVGRRRHPARRARASNARWRRLAELDAQLSATGVADGDRAFNLTWHDWLNLQEPDQREPGDRTSALEREDSRGAHFREDHPQTGDLEGSTYIVVRQDGQGLVTSREPVHFTRVVPGQTTVVEPAEQAA